MVTLRKRRPTNLGTLYLGDVPLEQVQCFKYLSVILSFSRVYLLKGQKDSWPVIPKILVESCFAEKSIRHDDIVQMFLLVWIPHWTSVFEVRSDQ